MLSDVTVVTSDVGVVMGVATKTDVSIVIDVSLAAMTAVEEGLTNGSLSSAERKTETLLSSISIDSKTVCL